MSNNEPNCIYSFVQHDMTIYVQRNYNYNDVKRWTAFNEKLYYYYIFYGA